MVGHHHIQNSLRADEVKDYYHIIQKDTKTQHPMMYQNIN